MSKRLKFYLVISVCKEFKPNIDWRIQYVIHVRQGRQVGGVVTLFLHRGLRGEIKQC